MATLAATALAVLGGLGGAAPAMAANSPAVTPLSQQTIAQFQAIWNEYGVSSSAQNALIADYNSGRPWDSFTNGATPVSERTTTGAGVTSTVETYADGSILVNTLQEPTPVSSSTTGGAHPDASISGCKVTESSHFDYTESCTVSTNVVVATFGYNVVYHVANGGPSSIVDHSAMTDACLGGSCSEQRVVTLRTTQSGSTPAEVQGTLEFTAYSGIASITYALWFTVHSGITSSSNN